jgi:hypothetical protein
MGRGKRFTFVYSAFICIAAMQSEAMGIAALSELSLRYKHLPDLKHIARSCDPAQLGVRTCHSKLTTEFTRNQNDHNTSFTAILFNLEFAKHHISVSGITTYPQYLQARSSKRSNQSDRASPLKKRLLSLPHNRRKPVSPSSVQRSARNRALLRRSVIRHSRVLVNLRLVVLEGRIRHRAY